MAKAETTAVIMRDGRTLQFGKIEKVQKNTLMVDGRPVGIQFDGRNGDSVKCMFTDLPDADWIEMAEPNGVSLGAMVHGFRQKLGDEYANVGAVEDCLETVRGLWQRLTSGKWDSDTRGFGVSVLLLDAVLLAWPHMAREKAREILNEMKPGERTALQLTPEVKPHFDRLQAERTKGDTTQLVARFQKAE